MCKYKYIYKQTKNEAEGLVKHLMQKTLPFLPKLCKEPAGREATPLGSTGGLLRPVE